MIWYDMLVVCFVSAVYSSLLVHIDNKRCSITYLGLYTKSFVLEIFEVHCNGANSLYPLFLFSRLVNLFAGMCVLL